jgi:hypothetical protein
MGSPGSAALLLGASLSGTVLLILCGMVVVMMLLLLLMMMMMMTTYDCNSGSGDVNNVRARRMRCKSPQKR